MPMDQSVAYVIFGILSVCVLLCIIVAAILYAEARTCRRRGRGTAAMFTVLSLFCGLHAHAREESINVKVPEWANTVMVGKLYPQKIIKELRASRRALARVRERLNAVLKRAEAGKTADLKYALEELKSLEKRAEKAFKGVDARHDRDFNQLRGQLEKLANDADYMARVNDVNALESEITNLYRRIEDLEEKTWGIGVSVASAIDWDVDLEKIVPIELIGVSGYWANHNLLLGLTVSVGVNPKALNLSWNFLGSVEWRVSRKWSVGPVMSLSQDLGNMEGVQTMLWTGGVRVRFLSKDWGVSLIPMNVGTRGLRGIKGEDPEWEFNFGTMIIFDYFVI